MQLSSRDERFLHWYCNWGWPWAFLATVALVTAWFPVTNIWVAFVIGLAIGQLIVAHRNRLLNELATRRAPRRPPV